MNQEQKYFATEGDNQGQLDSDSAPFAIGKNAWINMENFRTGSTDKGYTAVLESIGGTLRISTPSPSVSFLRIGSTTDIVGNRIIYAYYNTTTNQHKIEVFDKTDGVIYLALLSSQVTGGLNFDKNHLIDGRVVNGIWYFNDNYNPPRKLNIDAAIKMNNPTYSTSQLPYTNPLESSVITLIRRPPTYPLSVVKQTSGSVIVNNVADFAGFFSWRYTFRDNEISVLSTPSQLVNYNKNSDTTNEVIVVAVDSTGTPEHIPQDVEVVDFCVKYVGDVHYNVIASWDKRIASQATEIANHNAGISALNYTFLNDKVGLTLDAAYSVKPYDSVPLLSGTIETGLNRLFLGYNLSGYDTPVLSSLAITLLADTNPVFQNPIFMSASPYQLGIVFLDDDKRVIGNVFTNNSYIIQIPERDYNYSSYVKAISWTLSNAAAVNEIPIDARFYSIVITKNLRTRFFIEAKSAGMKYAIKDPLTGIISYQDTYVSTAYGLAFDASLLNAEGMGYSFQEGDILKVYQSASAVIFSLAVITQDGNYIISKLENLGSFAVQPNIIFQIYSPYKPSTNEAFFTVGSTYAITNAGTSGRIYSTINGNFSGDIWTFGRNAPSGSYVAENMSPVATHWQEWNTNSGEVNFNINSIQVRKATATQWSNVIIEGSQTNGLSTFDALDEKILPLALGTLQKLQQTSKVQEQGNVILAIGEQETASLYLGEVQLVGAAQNAFIASSPSVIGTVNILKGSFGTTMPSSVFEYRGVVFWLDMNNGRWIQYASNGLFPISNYKMVRFWKLWCAQFISMTTAQIEALGGRPFVFSTVDPQHDELLVSIPKLSSTPPKGYLLAFRIDTDMPINIIYPFDIYDLQGGTIVYDLKADRWIGRYSFNPEGFATIQNELYSFKDGQFYLHNQPNQCEFYGVQYKAKIMPISNEAPQIPKVYNNISIESNLCPTYTYLYNDYPYQQISDLADFNYTVKEGIWYATILRNIIQPTVTGYSTASRLTGEKMRNVAMYMMFEFSPTTTPVQVKFLNIGFIISLGNTNVIPQR